MKMMMKIRHTGVALWVVCALGLALAPEARAASADAKAEMLISDVANNLLGLFSEPDSTPREKEEHFRHLFLKHATIRRTGFFMLGNYARRMTSAQRKAYAELLPDFIVKVYFRRLATYEGTGKIHVTGSRKKGKKNREVIVSSTLTSPLLSQPVRVEWWVWRGKDGAFRIFDINVAGFWLAQEQRASFTALIARNQGKPQALLDYLETTIAKSDKGELPPLRPPPKR